MITELTILGREIPVYGIIGITGVCLGLAYALFSCRKFGLSRDDTLYIFVFGAIGAMIGAKLLYVIVAAGDIRADIASGELPMSVIAVKYLSGGMVFYGGMLGGLAASRYTAGRYGRRVSEFFPVLIPALALAHGIARIGCFLVGCCYGVEMDGILSVTYRHSLIAPNGTALFPVQLIEAACEIAIFIILAHMSSRIAARMTSGNAGSTCCGMNILWAYVLMYAPVRFILEFFRGDQERGFIMQLSVSQWISVVLMVAACIALASSHGKFSKEGETSP